MVRTNDAEKSAINGLYKFCKLMNEELPKDWKWAISSEILDIRDGTHATPKYVNENGIPLITSKNLKGNKIDFEKISYISKEDHVEISKRSKVEEGEILFSMIGTIGNPAVIKGNSSFSIKNVGLFKKNEKVILPAFLANFLSSYNFEKQLNEKKLIKGTTQRFIPLGNLRKINIPLPPKPTQLAIVSKIEELFSELEKGIESLFTAKQQLKTYQQSVLKWAFEGKLTEDWRMHHKSLSDAKDLILRISKSRQIEYNKKLENWKKRKADANEKKISKPQKPSNLDIKNDLFEGLVQKENIPLCWEIAPLVFVSDNEPNSIVDGPFGSSINVAEDYIESGVPVIRMVNIRPFRFVSDQMKFIKESKFQSLRRHNILPNDLLIAKVGATIGDCCLYPFNQPEAMLSTTGSCRVRLDKNVMDGKFLEYYISFHRSTLKEIASQTAQPFLNMKVLKSFPIVLPTIDEQHKIVQAIESRFSVADKMEESTTQSLQQAEALKQSILKKAFEGKLL